MYKVTMERIVSLLWYELFNNILILARIFLNTGWYFLISKEIYGEKVRGKGQIKSEWIYEGFGFTENNFILKRIPIFLGGNHEEKSNICSNSSEGRVGENEIDLACFEPWNMAIKLH